MSLPLSTLKSFAVHLLEALLDRVVEALRKKS